LEISKGNLAVENILAETVQVFWPFCAFFQRKRRRDVCKNALLHFTVQRLFKFLLFSIAAGNFNLVFIFTKAEAVFGQKVLLFFYLAVALVNFFFCALFSSLRRGSWDLRGFFDQKLGQKWR